MITSTPPTLPEPETRDAKLDKIKLSLADLRKLLQSEIAKEGDGK